MSFQPWSSIAQLLVNRIEKYRADSGRTISQVRFRLLAVMELRSPNYVPCDADWRDLDNALRVYGFVLYRPDAISLVIRTIETARNSIQLSLHGNGATENANDE